MSGNGLLERNGVGATRAVRLATSDRPRPDWEGLVARFGGGFFHSAAALHSALPEGEPLFATLLAGSGEPVGIAIGATQRCRLGVSARHVRLAAPPALAGGVDRTAACGVLVEGLAAEGAVEIAVDSFDSEGEAPVLGGEPGRERDEHVVELEPEATALLARFGTTHRRHIRRGERSGLRLETPQGPAALEMLYNVQSSAGRRAAGRGNRFTASQVRSAATTAFGAFDEPSGLAVAAATLEGQVLTAVLVGWAGGRAFYLQGGSTPRGYSEHAAAWLHYRLMVDLAGRGFTHYNLGGTPAAAQDPSHPQHGLFRFKQHFDARLARCRGARWIVRPGHLRMHSLLNAIAGRLRAA